MKPFLSDKIVSKEPITLVEKNEIISEESKLAKTLNYFFSYIVTNLKIPEYKGYSISLIENVQILLLNLF